MTRDMVSHTSILPHLAHSGVASQYLLQNRNNLPQYQPITHPPAAVPRPANLWLAGITMNLVPRERAAA
jgi:hypothetical protein